MVYGIENNAQLIRYPIMMIYKYRYNDNDNDHDHDDDDHHHHHHHHHCEIMRHPKLTCSLQQREPNEFRETDLHFLMNCIGPCKKCHFNT